MLNRTTIAKLNLNRACRRTFWQFYDNILLLFIINVIWIFFSASIVLMPTATLSLFFISYLIAHGNDVKLKSYFIFIYKLFAKSTVLCLALTLILLILIFNFRFYIQKSGIIGLTLTGFSFWLILFSLLSFQYSFVLACKFNNILKIISYSYIVTFDNLKTSLIIFISLAMLLVLNIILPIIGMSIIALYLQNIFLEIEQKYNKDLQITDPKRNFKEIFKFWHWE